MRRFVPSWLALALLSLGAALVVGLAPSWALAQPPADDEEEVDAEEGEGEPDAEEDPYADEDDWDDEEEEPGLRPPVVEDLEPDEEDYEDEEEDEEDDVEDEDDDELPSPAEAQQRLEEGPAGDSDPTLARWTTPQTVFDLHGYIRFRGEFQDNFFLDRVLGESMNMNVLDSTGGYVRGNAPLPFGLFRPAEDGVIPAGGGCGFDSDGRALPCAQHANAYANMRLRIEPTIHLSDDVRIRMQFDVLDNLVLGSTPNALAVGPRVGAGGIIDPFYRYERTTFAPIDTLSTTMTSPTYGLNSVNDAIQVRRAWGEVRNRGLGELRFGRMGDHWGLGLVANGGSGIDSDYQTDVDRIMIITRLAGIYMFGAWDFASEGLLYNEVADVGGIPFDRSRIDDTDQFVLGAAYRATDEEREAALQRGDAVFNIGARFQYRSQNLSSYGTTNPFGLCTICGDAESDLPSEERRFADPVFVRRGADIYTPDLWIQFLYENLRLELEAVMTFGQIENLGVAAYTTPEEGNQAELLQFGIAFEGEYHLLNDQLGIYFNAGYASGDADQEGLSLINGLPAQNAAGEGDGRVDRTYSTFYFHPNYRVDLIFWRNIMRQVGGAYYFRPGLSYDFIKNSFGQLLGARADVIWSRAAEPIQSWGNADDLGVEIDVSAYYRSEDGPDLLDGFYAQAQWGIFFPLDGLGFGPGSPSGTQPAALGPAMTFRLLLGIQY